MSRYIDADNLIIRMDRWYEEMRLKYGETDQFNMGYAEGITAIENAPSADVVEVVRCRDCKHYGGVTYGFVCRKYSGVETKVCTEKDHYCSYGERREK